MKKINCSFRCSTYPQTFNELIEYYAHKIQHMTGDIKIITSTKKQVNKVRGKHYEINREELNNYLDLYQLSDERRKYLIKSKYFNELKPAAPQAQAPDEEDNPDFLDEQEINYLDIIQEAPTMWNPMWNSYIILTFILLWWLKLTRDM